jgi:hypothetical protein
VKLHAKGRSNDFVTLAKVPDEAAGAEARVVLRAFREAVEGLLALSTTPDVSEAVRKGMLANYLGLRDLHRELETDIEQLGFILMVIEQKLKSI